MLAFKPFGGSFVILMPDWSTGTGNSGEGMEVNHKRYSSATLSGSICSWIRSNVGIQLPAKWQFCRHTQSPSSTPWATIASAFGPCPCPSEIMCKRSSKPFALASRSSWSVGSAPADNTKMIGEHELESSYDPIKSNGGLSVYNFPSSPPTKFRVAILPKFSRNDRITNKRWNHDNLLSQFFGNGRVHMSSAVTNDFHSALLAWMSLASPAHPLPSTADTPSKTDTMRQTCSSHQSGCGVGSKSSNTPSAASAPRK
mmetsp:Transcript_58452/g.132389  ORF Transcript_58452/g.132389 Transcript_58452/m.132389 type:complete len:256 (+) Transcript_58452:1671-2438(+)